MVSRRAIAPSHLIVPSRPSRHRISSCHRAHRVIASPSRHRISSCHRAHRVIASPLHHRGHFLVPRSR
jgi:hypothetical protein